MWTNDQRSVAFKFIRFTHEHVNKQIKHRGERPTGADLVLGARSVSGGADHHVDAAALARPVQMLPDGQHRPRPLAPTFQAERGEHPIHHLDVALQLHGSGETGRVGASEGWKASAED